MNNVITFPRSLPWRRHAFPPLLTDRVDTYLRDLDECIEAQRRAMSALARELQMLDGRKEESPSAKSQDWDDYSSVPF